MNRMVFGLDGIDDYNYDKCNLDYLIEVRQLIDKKQEK